MLHKIGCFNCNPCASVCETQPAAGASSGSGGFALAKKRREADESISVDADDMLELTSSTLSSSAILAAAPGAATPASTPSRAPPAAGSAASPSTPKAGSTPGAGGAGGPASDIVATVSAITRGEPPPGRLPPPSWLEEERAVQAAIAAAHQRLYVPHGADFDQLNAYADADGPEILVLSGPAGCGKSALLANWSAARREERPEEAVLLHVAGGCERGRRPGTLVRRLVSELRELEPRLKPPERASDPAEGLLCFGEWLGACGAALQRRVVLVVDGADELEAEGGALWLPWLPHAASERLRIVLSCAAGEAHTAAQRRPHALARVARLEGERRRAVAAGRRRLRHRTPVWEAALQRLLASEQAASPLFLCAALEMLQEELLDAMRQLDGGGARGRAGEDPAGAILACADAPALLRRVLARWEGRYGAALVQPALCALRFSLAGMADSELQLLLGVAGRCAPGAPAPSAPIPPRLYSDWRAAALASGLLVDCNGLLRFFHNSAAEAVEGAYGLGTPEAAHRWHAWLGAFFASLPASRRRAEECPRHLERAGALDALAEARAPPARPSPANAGAELARMWAASGRAPEAPARLRRALDAYEASAACDVTQLADDLAAASLLLRLLGEYEAAMPLIERSVALREEAAWGPAGRGGLAGALERLGDARVERGSTPRPCPSTRPPPPPRPAAGAEGAPDTLRRIAECLDKEGRYSDAEAVLTRALRVAESSHGQGSAAAGRVLLALAGAAQEQGLFEEALEHLHRCQRIVESLYGPDHPEARPPPRHPCAPSTRPRQAALVLNNSANLDALRGELPAAEAAYRRALEIREGAYGGDHPAVAASLRNLALLLQMLQRPDEAEPLFLRAIKIEERSLGVDHPSLAQTLSSLGLLYQSQERFDRAEYLFKRSLQLVERRLGGRHRDVARELDNLAGLYVAMGRPDEAEPLYERSIAVRQAVHGPNHWTVADAVRAVARLREVQGRTEEAEALYMQALEGLEVALPPGHPLASACVAQVADFYRASARLPEAEAMYRRVVAMRGASRGQHDQQLVAALEALTSLCEEAGRVEEAEAFLRAAARLQLADLLQRAGDEGAGVEPLEEAARLLDADPVRPAPLPAISQEADAGLRQSGDAGVLAQAVASRLRQALWAAGRGEEAEALPRRPAGGPLARASSSLSQHLLMLQSLHRG
eukprot:tig00000792_g4196.t1